MLHSLNNKYIQSSTKTKIELYFVPLILLYLLYYFLGNSISPELNKIRNIDQYANKKFDSSFLKLFGEIEKSAKALDIKVKSLNNKMNIIELEIDTKIENIGKLINKLENINNFTKISSITVIEKEIDNIYSIIFTIDVNKFYIKEIKKDEFQSNKKVEIKIEENNKIKKLTIENEIKYELKAIIADFAMINNKWIKKDEYIDNFKLINIGKNFVFLENEEKEIKLEITNEEYLKKIY